MISLKNVLLIAASISFVCVIGGAIYEHLAIVPAWSAAPPLSLSMFQGKYGVNAGVFWQLVHPVTLLLLLATLLTSWKSDRRKNLILCILGYVLVLIATFIYFVPELLGIINTPYQQTVNAELQSSAKLWEKLSIVRLIFMVVLAVLLLSALTRNTQATKLVK